MAGIIVIVVIVVGTLGTSFTKGFAIISPILAVPMDGSALVGGLHVFDDEALHKRVTPAVVILDAPQAVPTVELGDAGPVLEKVLETETDTLLLAVSATPLIIEAETLFAEMTAVEEHLVARWGIAVATREEEGLEEVLQMWTEGLCLPRETAVVGFAAEIGSMVEAHVKDDGAVGIGAQMKFLLMIPHIGCEERGGLTRLALAVPGVTVALVVIVEQYPVAAFEIDLQPPLVPGMVTKSGVRR